MDIGIGLPNAVRGVDRRGIVEWARRAEGAGFSSLGTIDRIVYPSYESLTRERSDLRPPTAARRSC